MDLIDNFYKQGKEALKDLNEGVMASPEFIRHPFRGRDNIEKIISGIMLSSIAAFVIALTNFSEPSNLSEYLSTIKEYQTSGALGSLLSIYLPMAYIERRIIQNQNSRKEYKKGTA